MSRAAGDLLVGVMVAVSVVYSLWRLGPQVLREAITRRFSTLLPQAFHAKDARPNAGGCEACSGCAYASKRTHATDAIQPIHSVPLHKRSKR